MCDQSGGIAGPQPRSIAELNDLLQVVLDLQNRKVMRRGKPRLWAHGSKDRAIGMMPWPLPMVGDVVEDAPVGAIPDGAANAVAIDRRGAK